MTTRSVLLLFVTLFVWTPAIADVRIKDVTYVEGQMRHSLTGIGLVTGLAGTGGTNPQTREFVANLLQRSGNRMRPEQRALLENNTRLKTDNIAVVAVTAKVPEYMTPGATFDVTVSVIDDAENLAGGVLLDTPLYAIDGQVYAMASGSVTTGGFSFSGDAGSAQKNHPTTGTSVGAGSLKQPLCVPDSTPIKDYRLSLQNPDLETARRIAMAINAIAEGAARVMSPATVAIQIPKSDDIPPAEFMSQVDQLRIKPDTEARVVINERTGTVVFGENVRISGVAFVHANLTVVTSETPEVSQPEPLANGQTAVLPRTDIEVIEGDRAIQVVEETASVGDLVEALNALGVTPRDLSSIFQRLKAANALHATLEIQ